ncbi:hypothetical protein HNY73_005976 [Argiope bruennichi]|uniref:Uncharacterized protein n=2 Tax=Argiope bruennichi TaxID=94029 RepID=A0A8T0FJD1_ARGBR|nr:hypothetical protein HNY73_005976 [Argiope bruennichi]
MPRSHRSTAAKPPKFGSGVTVYLKGTPPVLFYCSDQEIMAEKKRPPPLDLSKIVELMNPNEDQPDYEGEDENPEQEEENLAEMAQPVRERTDNVAQPVRERTADAAQPVRERTANSAQPVRERTANAAQPVRERRDVRTRQKADAHYVINRRHPRGAGPSSVPLIHPQDAYLHEASPPKKSRRSPRKAKGGSSSSADKKKMNQKRKKKQSSKRKKRPNKKR